jgi:hypothetical protein
MYSRMVRRFYGQTVLLTMGRHGRLHRSEAWYVLSVISDRSFGAVMSFLALRDYEKNLSRRASLQRGLDGRGGSV